MILERGSEQHENKQVQKEIKKDKTKPTTSRKINAQSIVMEVLGYIQTVYSPK